MGDLTILNKYQDYLNKIKQTNLERYGVEYPQQNPEIAEKASKNSYRKKTYILPSGKQILCQGYEPLALDKLIKEENLLEDDTHFNVLGHIKNFEYLYENFIF